MTTAFDLKGKVAFVTGGSNGIGAACVRQLAAAGATVVVGYNAGKERADKLVAGLPGKGHSAMQIRLEDSSTLSRAAGAVKDQYQRADILINCAGFTKLIPHKNLDALDDATFDAIMTVNVRGAFALVRAFAPLLKASGDAVIVNISSNAASHGTGSNIAYGASKAAIDTMTKSLGRVLGPEIRVISLSPAAVDTDFVPGRARAVIEKMAEESPLKKLMGPEEVALSVLGCITHLRYTTGSVVVSDSGRHLIG